MSVFSDIVRGKQAPKSMVLPLGAWAYDWRDRPSGEVALGLRPLSDLDIENIRHEAARYAVKAYLTDDGGTIDEVARVEAYNDALMIGIVGRASCDPNNVDASFFDREEDTVRNALTKDGIRHIFDEYDRFRAEESANIAPIVSEDMQELAARLQAGESENTRLSSPRRLRIAKLLALIIEELRAADPDYLPVDDQSPIRA